MSAKQYGNMSAGKLRTNINSLEEVHHYLVTIRREGRVTGKAASSQIANLAAVIRRMKRSAAEEVES